MNENMHACMIYIPAIREFRCHQDGGWLPTKMPSRATLIILEVLLSCQVWPSALQTLLKTNLSAPEWGHISETVLH